jgi:kynureninase
VPGHAIDTSEEFARHRDSIDPLRGFRERFEFPRLRRTGLETRPAIYLAGNSLGLMPKSVREIVNEELDDWAALAVDAHFDARRPWYSYHEIFRDPGARLVCGESHPDCPEVVMMNSLTLNLHLMLTTFYRPTKDRHRILIESHCFPSDRYAVQSHLGARGIEQSQGIVEIAPRPGDHLIRTDDVEELLAREGESIAVVLLPGVNFFTGQAFDIERITRAAHAQGCIAGWDLAHAAGNLTMRLHDWNADFAVWCSYKYLNAGPGAVAGCFVHEKHGRNLDLPRFAGWWGNDPATRFNMLEERVFRPRAGADGWQISNPPIFAMAPLKASLDIFDEATMPALRAKSLEVTTYLRGLLERDNADNRGFEITTPREPNRHGCQLSILVHDRPRERFQALLDAGVVCDFRAPNVIRAAPAPLYNSFHDCWTFARVFDSLA